MKTYSIWTQAAAITAVTKVVLARPEPSCSRKCCNALAKDPALQGRVVYPNSTVYEDRVESIFSLDAALSPWCIVLPTSTEETAAAISVIHSNECPFGIRSGGHAMFANSNNVQDGVTIDFGMSRWS